jgi:hypothetical protein
MVFTLSDWIQLCIFIVSLSVFVLKPTPSILKYYPVYFFGGLVMNIFQEYTSNRGIHNTGVVNAYAIVDFSFLFLVLRSFIINPKVRKFILFIIVIFDLFAAINLIFIQKKVGFNPINFTIQSLISALLCIYYFIELFQKTEAPSLYRLPAFWITSAIFFNVVLSFPMFALLSFMNELTRTNQVSFKIIFKNIGTIYYIITILTYTLYSIGFLCVIRINKSTL